MNQITKKKRGPYVAVLFSLFNLIVSLHGVGSNGDSTKTKYDISDPRNPDCPCHKYQIKAEKEYQRLLSEKKKEKQPAEYKKIDGGMLKQDAKKQQVLKRRRYIFHKNNNFKGRSGYRKRERRNFRMLFRKDITKCFHM